MIQNVPRVLVSLLVFVGCFLNILVKVMSCLIELFAYRYGFRGFDIFSVILKAFSAFPTYWILQSSHYSKYMMKLILQIVFWNILNVLLVWLLLKCSVFITCLPQTVLEFEKHGERFPLVNLLLVSSFLFFLLCSLQPTFLCSCFCGRLTGAYFQITF